MCPDRRGIIFFVSFSIGFLGFAHGIEKIDVDSSSHGERSSVEDLREPSTALIVELSKNLLDRLKTVSNEEIVNIPVGGKILETFDSTGLRNRIVYKDRMGFFDGIKNLKESQCENDFCPTLHVVFDLIQNRFPVGGSVILMTKSKISDEEFADDLAESLRMKRCRLTIFWSGENKPINYKALKELAKKTGGKFFIFSNGKREFFEISDEDPETESFDHEKPSGKSVTDFFQKIRFPEEEITELNESDLILRSGNEKTAGNVYFPLMVEVASGANLEIRPGIANKIPFNVKNNLNTNLKIVFGAKLNNVPQIIQPQRAFLQPLSSTTVNVILQGIPNAPSNGTLTLTFSAFLPSKVVSRSAIVSLLPRTVDDRTKPKLSYKYGGDCSKYLKPDDCGNGLWSVEVTALDEESGILKMTSEPYGLFFQTDFVAGTKLPVKAFYGATCCHPKVDIWTEDLTGNYAKISFDVFNQNLLPGEIAAISVGVLLLLFIIIAIIVAVVLVKRRNRRNLIIPRARAESR